MAKIPPLLPTEVLRRVLRIAQLDGTGLLAFAGGFALLSAWCHDTTSTVAGLLIAGAGAIELHGAGLIRNGREDGVRWLIASQLYLMGAVFCYVAWRLTHIDTSLMASLVTDDMRTQLEQLQQQYGMTESDFLHFLYVGVYASFGVLTAIYQGGMTIYYARRRAPLITALEEIHGHEG